MMFSPQNSSIAQPASTAWNTQTVNGLPVCCWLQWPLWPKLVIFLWDKDSVSHESNHPVRTWLLPRCEFVLERRSSFLCSHDTKQRGNVFICCLKREGKRTDLIYHCHQRDFHSTCSKWTTDTEKQLLEITNFGSDNLLNHRLWKGK